jgi:hypothetical protein
VVTSATSATYYFERSNNSSPLTSGAVVGTYNITNNGSYIGLVGDNYGVPGSVTYIDNIIVRKYTSPPPTVNLGEEEAVYSRTDYFGGTAAIAALSNTTVSNGDVVLTQTTALHTYDYNGVQQANSLNKAYQENVSIPGNMSYLSAWADAPSNIVSQTQATNVQYTLLWTSDDTRWALSQPGTNNSTFVMFNMSIIEPKDMVTNISLMFEGQTGGQISTHRMWIYNANYDVWEILGPDMSIPGADGNMTRWQNTSCANYINASGVLHWGVSANRTNAFMYIDYVQANISYKANYSSTGNVTSTNVSLGNSSAWAMFYANHSLPANTNISYTILRANDSAILWTINAAQALAGYNISTCAANVSPIKLYANLSTSNTSLSPQLQTWSVTRATPPTTTVVFTSNGSWTVPSCVTSVQVLVVAGDGGRGGGSRQGGPPTDEGAALVLGCPHGVGR